MAVGLFGRGRRGAGVGVGRGMLLTSGTSALALGAIAAAMLVPTGTKQVPGSSAPAASVDLGPLELLSESEAMAQAVAAGAPVEVTSLTTATTLITAKPDGGFVAEISAMPVRVKDSGGSWRPVDTTLVRRPDGSIAPAMAAVPMLFSDGGSGAPLAQIADGDRSMAISWPAAGDLPEPELTGSVARYVSVLPGVDVVAQAGVTGFSTFVVVHDAQAAKHPAVQALAFDVDADGVTLRDEPTGGVSAVDGTETVFNSSQPLAWDSRGVGAESTLTEEERAVDAPLSPPVKASGAVMDIEVGGGQLRLDSDAILDDPRTVFPAVLDPSVDRNGAKAWTMVWSNGTTIYDHATEHARVGFDGWSPTSAQKISRSYFKMDMPTTLRGKMIDTARLAHKLTHTPNSSCSAATYGPPVQVYRTKAFSSSTSWSNQPDRLGEVLDEDATDNGSETSCGGWTRQEWDVKGAIVDATLEVKDEVYFLLKSKAEGDKYGWRKYDNTDAYPSLTVEYYAYPPAPSAATVSPLNTTPLHGSWTSTLRPTLKALDVIDPNGGSSYARFEIWDNGEEIWSTVSDGGSATGHTANVVVPAGVLVNGEDYKVKAYAAADSAGKWDSEDAAEFTFGVDDSVPAVPTITRGGDCVVGTGCAFTFAGSADTLSYSFGMNTDTALTSKVLTSPGPYTTSIYAATFGPGWVIVKAVDRAGHTSKARVLNFPVLSTSMSHRWALDGNGTDSDQNTFAARSAGAAPLSFAGGGAIYGLGSYPAPLSAPVDTADKSLTLGGGRYASAGVAGTGLLGFSTADDFTVAAWVKAPTGGEGVALSQGSAAGNAFTLGHRNDSWAFTVTGENGTEATASVPIRPEQGPWVHLAAVFNNASDEEIQESEDGSTAGRRSITLYVNGRAGATIDAPAVRAADGLFYIGRAATGTTFPLSTAIDEVRTFPGVLDYSQVLRMASERRPY
ncbi:MAG: LamG-like jellyroll fold domain-containing protein [Sporichthyaceae bacterium]